MKSHGRTSSRQPVTTLAPSPRRRQLASRADVDAVVTSFPLPRALHNRARYTALRLNWSFAELARAAIAEWLARHRVSERGSEKGRLER